MKIQFCFGLLLMSFSLYSQTDFTGTWKLNIDKTQFNNTPGSPAANKIIVEQKTDTITFQRNDRPKETLKIDSTAEIEIIEGETKTKVSIKWATDKLGLIETRNYSYEHNHEHEVAMKKTRTWSLSADKKNMTIRDQIQSTTGNTYEMILVYDRQ